MKRSVLTGAVRFVPTAPVFKSLPVKMAEHPAEKKRYGCLMLKIPDKVCKSIREWAKQIPKEHLAPDGLEDHYHITVKYGFVDDGSEVKTLLRELLSQFGPIKVRLGPLSLFRGNEDGDVLKMVVFSPQLMKLNERVSASFECEDKYPVYRPHMTIAYLKPEFSGQYDGAKVGFVNTTCLIDTAEFGDKEKKVTAFSLKKSFASKSLSMVKFKAIIPDPLEVEAALEDAGQQAVQFIMQGNPQRAYEILRVARLKTGLELPYVNENDVVWNIVLALEDRARLYFEQAETIPEFTNPQDAQQLVHNHLNEFVYRLLIGETPSITNTNRRVQPDIQRAQQNYAQETSRRSDREDEERMAAYDRERKRSQLKQRMRSAEDKDLSMNDEVSGGALVRPAEFVNRLHPRTEKPKASRQAYVPAPHAVKGLKSLGMVKFKMAMPTDEAYQLFGQILPDLVQMAIDGDEVGLKDTIMDFMVRVEETAPTEASIDYGSGFQDEPAVELAERVNQFAKRVMDWARRSKDRVKSDDELREVVSQSIVNNWQFDFGRGLARHNYRADMAGQHYDSDASEQPYESYLPRQPKKPKPPEELKSLSMVKFQRKAMHPDDVREHLLNLVPLLVRNWAAQPTLQTRWERLVGDLYRHLDNPKMGVGYAGEYTFDQDFAEELARDFASTLEEVAMDYSGDEMIKQAEDSLRYNILNTRTQHNRRIYDYPADPSRPKLPRSEPLKSLSMVKFRRN